MKTSVSLTLLAAAMLAATLAATGLAEQELPDHEAVFEQVAARFTPLKPTVVITYSVNYRLLGMRLFSIATALIEATEGLWHDDHNNETTPACLINVVLQSTRIDDDAKEHGRVYINDRICSVSTMPALDTLYYIKRTDEYINPPFMRDKRVDNIAIYDLTRDELDFLACDYITGEIHTNLTGAADMAAQGREVSRVLTMISDVYHKRAELITPDSDFRIHVNCDGVAVPFAARTRMDKISILDRKWPALRADVMPAREAPKVNNRDFSMWATSFEEVARQLDDPLLTELAAEAPPWGMAPLIANYGLSLGHIRASVVSIEARPLPETCQEAAQVAALIPRRDAHAGELDDTP